eukprot:Tbor_TRINITY_DN5883_c1_g10::TRINITY_DN5883_c1_g10_i1::g.6514::m.6514
MIKSVTLCPERETSDDSCEFANIPSKRPPSNNNSGCPQKKKKTNVLEHCTALGLDGRDPPVHQDMTENVVVVPEKFDTHPGGQSTLNMARNSGHPDFHFLMYHLGFDHDKIRKECKRRGVIFPKTGPFYEELHEAVTKVRKQHPEQYYIYCGFCILLTILLPSLYYQYAFVCPQWWMTVLLSLVMISYFFNIFHMRHHKGSNVYRNKFLNRITEPLYDVIDNVYGVQPAAWIANHQDSHHVVTNSMTEDHDVFQPFPFLRLNPYMEIRWFHRYQTFYCFFIFMLVTLSYPFDNMVKWKSSKLWFVLWIVMNIAIPYYNNGMMIFYHLSFIYVVTGLGMSYLFQVSHNNCRLGSKLQPTRNIDEMMIRQIQESVSWGGYTANLVFGGISMQTEHHICPAHDPTLYYYISKEFQRIAPKYGVKYTFENTFWDALCQYHKALYYLGTAEQVKKD